jgi:hypothetical protein
MPEGQTTPAGAEARANGARAPGQVAVRKGAAAIARAFETGEYPYRDRPGVRAYEAEKARLQAELLKVQIWAQETGRAGDRGVRGYPDQGDAHRAEACVQVAAGAPPREIAVAPRAV